MDGKIQMSSFSNIHVGERQCIKFFKHCLQAQIARMFFFYYKTKHYTDVNSITHSTMRAYVIFLSILFNLVKVPRKKLSCEVFYVLIKKNRD